MQPGVKSGGGCQTFRALTRDLYNSWQGLWLRFGLKWMGFSCSPVILRLFFSAADPHSLANFWHENEYIMYIEINIPKHYTILMVSPS